jgi:rRNA maturation endonuclease Nob1
LKKFQEGERMETVTINNPEDDKRSWDWFCPICGCINLAEDKICVACGEEVKIILPGAHSWMPPKKEEEEYEEED